MSLAFGVGFDSIHGRLVPLDCRSHVLRGEFDRGKRLP